MSNSELSLQQTIIAFVFIAALFLLVGHLDYLQTF